ncbi:hypothetical protein PHET_04656 [Paragonimus heterotremus]|uniref:Uncharacterized protein n=1 Tax=Paragonimus heterotremus TaxID=100268 RepID=A0A8J4SN92_9TREM|nr:hypothetical protein PHET_04656 [Paragonimus heterotremus]
MIGTQSLTNAYVQMNLIRTANECNDSSDMPRLLILHTHFETSNLSFDFNGATVVANLTNTSTKSEQQSYQ